MLSLRVWVLELVAAAAAAVTEVEKKRTQLTLLSSLEVWMVELVAAAATVSSCVRSWWYSVTIALVG